PVPATPPRARALQWRRDVESPGTPRRPRRTRRRSGHKTIFDSWVGKGNVVLSFVSVEIGFAVDLKVAVRETINPRPLHGSGIGTTLPVVLPAKDNDVRRVCQ